MVVRYRVSRPVRFVATSSHSPTGEAEGWEFVTASPTDGLNPILLADGRPVSSDFWALH